MDLAPKPRTYRLKPAPKILAERPEAAQLRVTQLESLPSEGTWIIDLSSIDLMSLSAADELIAAWLLHKRASRREQGFVVALYSPSAIVHETLHAALRDRQLAAYGLTKLEGWSAGDVQTIGDVTTMNDRTLAAVHSFSAGAASAAQVAKKMGDTSIGAATNRLNELLSKGLIHKSDHRVASAGGRPSTRFVHPLGPSATSEVPALGRRRIAATA